MNKLLFLLLTMSLLSTTKVMGQCCPYLGTIEISPENPTTLDSVYLITNVTTPNVGSYLGSEIEEGDDNLLTVRSSYSNGQLTALTDFNETINLGTKEAGIYTVNFVALLYANDFNTGNLVLSDSNQVELTFEVTAVNSVQNENLDISVTCFPNPTIDQNVWVQSAEQMNEIKLIDFSGRIIFRRDNIRENEFELNTMDLMPGVYFIKVTNSNKESVLKKIVKM